MGHDAGDLVRHLAFAALLALADLSPGDSFAAFARAAFRAIGLALALRQFLARGDTTFRADFLQE